MSYSLIPFSVNGSMASVTVCSMLYWLCLLHALLVVSLAPCALRHTRVCCLHAAAACMVCWLDVGVCVCAHTH
uniref:Uncharacterized protein n=1 Tax=Triticum urartu TaxID=4572 RepID=A0A8R7TXE5_TRIUA